MPQHSSQTKLQPISSKEGDLEEEIRTRFPKNPIRPSSKDPPHTRGNDIDQAATSRDRAGDVVEGVKVLGKVKTITIWGTNRSKRAV